MNTILWVLFTGARWKDVPQGEQWASKTCAHKWLGIWMESGVLEKVLKKVVKWGGGKSTSKTPKVSGLMSQNTFQIRFQIRF